MISRPEVISGQVGVCVKAQDRISRDGIALQLQGQDIDLREALQDDSVVLLVVDEFDEPALREIRRLREQGMEKMVAVVTRVDVGQLLAAVEAGVRGVIRRSQSDPASLSQAIRRAAAGEGVLPGDLLVGLLDRVGEFHREGQSRISPIFTGLTDREASVLRLLAEGCDTGEVGGRLFLSERTVKGILHDVTCRLNLRNRTHAVAHAIREGLI